MHVEFGKKVRKDLVKIPPDLRQKVRSALSVSEFSPNADIKPLKGAEPWQRLRVGSYRIIFKQLSPEQLDSLGARTKKGILVLRILNRRDLDKEVSKLS